MKCVIVNDGDIYGYIFAHALLKNNIDVEFVKLPDSEKVVNENILLNVLKHFCENILIEDNKYFYGISCKVWNKEEDVREFLIQNDDSIIKYNKYCHWCKVNNKRFVVSKSYFDYMKNKI